MFIVNLMYQLLLIINVIVIFLFHNTFFEFPSLDNPFLKFYDDSPYCLHLFIYMVHCNSSHAFEFTYIIK